MTESIRILTPDDFSIWKGIRLEAVKIHPDAFGGSYEEESLRSDAEWIPTNSKSFIFGCFRQKTLIAVAGYFHMGGVKMQHRGKIFTVYIKEAFRGRRLMDHLLKAIEQHAHEHNIEQLLLDVGTDNLPAIACYERNGYKRYATDTHVLKLGDRYVDEYLMVKYL